MSGPDDGSRPGPTAGESLSWLADVALHPDHSMREATARMHEKGRPFAPVVDGDAVVGVLSLGGTANRASEPQDGVSVRDCMISTVPFLYDDDPVALGVAIGRQSEIEHFCVVDHDHRLLGILAVDGDGDGDGVSPHAAPEPVDSHTIRTRLAVTPSRSVSSEDAGPDSYADAPTLYLEARTVHEPRDRPDPAERRQRDQAMRSKL